MEKSLSIRRGNRVHKSTQNVITYIYCIERVYPKRLIPFVRITTIRNFSYFLWTTDFSGAIKILNTAISDHRYYFTSLRFFRSLLPEVFPKQNSWLLNLSLCLPGKICLQKLLFLLLVDFPTWFSSPLRLSFFSGVRLRRYPRWRKYSHSAQAAILARLLTSFCELKTISRFQV